MGPQEAAEVVAFWIRELEAMREELNVDWNSAYTTWRNMLSDYAVRWKEWSPLDSEPPTMWDWEERTQFLYQRVRDRGRVDYDETHRAGWKFTPVIFEELSLSEAMSYLGDDTSAFMTMKLDYRVGDRLKASRAEAAKAEKSKRQQPRRKRTREPKPLVVDDDSDDEGGGRHASMQENNGHGKICWDPKTKKPWSKDSDCPVFAEHGCCGFYHPHAPKGTTGIWSSLNDASKQILTAARRGPKDNYGRPGWRGN